MSPQDNEIDILTKPSQLELYESEFGGSAWILFIGILAFLGGIALSDHGNDIGPILAGWFIRGLMGYIGYVGISNSIKIERLRLAAHMLRSHALHARLANEKGDREAERLVVEMEKAERGFIKRAFRAASSKMEEAFVNSALDGIGNKGELPYIVVYRNGMLDAPSTIIHNMTAGALNSIMSLLAFLILGTILLAITVIIAPIVIFLTARALSKHVQRENEVRRILGLHPVTAEAPGIGGLLASILTLGLYIPFYAKSLVKSIDSHVVHS